MDHGLAHMIERSRHHTERLKARLASEAGGPAKDREEVIEDAANAVLACQFIAVRGGLFARSRAARLMREIQEQVRAAGLERDLTLRLKDKLGTLGSLFTRH